MLAAYAIAAFRAERLVFRDISFEVAKGGALLVRGPNGAGKSSLLRALAGLLPLAAGRVAVGGEAAITDLPAHSRNIAYLGHQDAVKPGLTGLENLRLNANLSQLEATAALARFGLSAIGALPARLYSAGQRRRLALARVAGGPAPVWLLDEPATGLDAGSQALLEAAIAAHRAAGGAVVATTHVPLALPGAAELGLR